MARNHALSNNASKYERDSLERYVPGNAPVASSTFSGSFASADHVPSSGRFASAPADGVHFPAPNNSTDKKSDGEPHGFGRFSTQVQPEPQYSSSFLPPATSPLQNSIASSAEGTLENAYAAPMTVAPPTLSPPSSGAFSFAAAAPEAASPNAPFGMHSSRPAFETPSGSEPSLILNSNIFKAPGPAEASVEHSSPSELFSQSMVDRLNRGTQSPSMSSSSIAPPGEGALDEQSNSRDGSANHVYPTSEAPFSPSQLSSMQNPPFSNTPFGSSQPAPSHAAPSFSSSFAFGKPPSSFFTKPNTNAPLTFSNPSNFQGFSNPEKHPPSGQFSNPGSSFAASNISMGNSSSVPSFSSAHSSTQTTPMFSSEDVVRKRPYGSRK